jgi:hypothetical protein
MILNMFRASLCSSSGGQLYIYGIWCRPTLYAAIQCTDQEETCFLLTGTADSHSPECVIPDDVLIQFGPPDDEYLLLETCRGIK